MDSVSIEQANYILANYFELLSLAKIKAVREQYSKFDTSDLGDERIQKMYQKQGWLSIDPEVLNHLSERYIQFVLNLAAQILADHPHKVFFNKCPVCKKLARTPFAKQCRLCNHQWHGQS